VVRMELLVGGKPDARAAVLRNKPLGWMVLVEHIRDEDRVVRRKADEALVEEPVIGLAQRYAVSEVVVLELAEFRGINSIAKRSIWPKPLTAAGNS